MVKKSTANLSILVLFLFFLYSVSSAQITYTLHMEANPTQDQQDACGRIKTAMDSAVGYYNKYTTITKILNVYYNPDVGTADASFNGTIRFGSNRSYMVVHTAMHEIAHTVGIGTSNEYRNLIKDGDFTGKHGTEMLREITSDPDAVLHGDNTHFWPYGLNYAHEVESDDDLVNHCKIVNAMYMDMFNEEFYKVCHLRSHESGMCMVSDGSTLKLGVCNDSSSLVRLISLNDENVFRLEFGDKVLDIPNESRSEGVAASLYSWNGGGHQRVIFEFESDNLVRLKMFHSGFYLRADGERIIQDNGYESLQAQYWEVIDGTVGPVVKVNTARQESGKMRIMNNRIALAVPSFGSPKKQIWITDLSGRLVQSRIVNCSKVILPVDNLAKGVYLLNLYCGKQSACSYFVVR